MPSRLVIFFGPLVVLSICRSGWGVGGLHTVSEDHHVRAARNEGEYKAGVLYPDFRPVCVVGRFRDPDDWQGSGVLVAPGWVLTAAHCVLRKKKAPRLERDLKVRFGSRTDDKSREYRVEAIHLTLPLDAKVLRPLLSERKVSRAATRRADRNDIALLKLDRDVEGIPVAPLHEGRAKPGTRICFAGFGCYATGLQKKEKHWKENGWKRAAENTLDRDGHHSGGGLIAFDFDNGQQQRNTLSDNRLLDGLLSKMLGPGQSQATPLPLEGDCYDGDSGCPIFARESGQWRVLGINSFGTDYPLQGRRGTTQYGDVSCCTRVPNHVSWIRRTIAGE